MTTIVSVKLPHALLVKVDGLAPNRSDFVREALEEKVARLRRKRKSAWDTFTSASGLNMTILKAPGRVKRIEL